MLPIYIYYDMFIKPTWIFMPMFMQRYYAQDKLHILCTFLCRMIYTFQQQILWAFLCWDTSCKPTSKFYAHDYVDIIYAQAKLLVLCIRLCRLDLYKPTFIFYVNVYSGIIYLSQLTYFLHMSMRKYCMQTNLHILWVRKHHL